MNYQDDVFQSLSNLFLFNNNHQVLHVSKNENRGDTNIIKMNSKYKDERFLNIFSDNEARLFFSEYILFVEGETELEIFRNRKLLQRINKLKHIDVYATNEVVLKYINPSYSNMSIPYLVLYDADKILNIDFSNSKFTTSSETINLKKIQQAYKKAYCGSPEFTIFSFLKELVGYEKKTTLTFKNKIYIDNLNMNMLVNYLNIYCLNYSNTFINKTTIEEGLINKDSFELFKKWIFREYLFFINDFFTISTPRSFKRKHKKIQIQNLKDFINLINDDFISTDYHTQDNIYTLFILLFNGKTETLISRENANWKKIIPVDYQEKFQKLETHISNIMKIKKNDFFGKTSGWTTRFLNFSIEEIDKNVEVDNFEQEFKKYFGELYDIINKINLSSDR